MPRFDKVVVITKRTAAEELAERFNTPAQARFYIEQSGAPFEPYEAAHRAYVQALDRLRQALPDQQRSQFVDRNMLPNFTFGPGDLVVTLGPDGLVVNVAKYLSGQTLLAVNPDPPRIDGILVPFPIEAAENAVARVLAGQFSVSAVSMARASLNDGQAIEAVNDLFIGQRTHVSARYRLAIAGKAEDQSSSGIIVTTGAGSTGWYRSILTGASRIAEAFTHETDIAAIRDSYRFGWDAKHLQFSVREPFVSHTSGAGIVFGRIPAGSFLQITSNMPQNGVIFSDGVEEDFLEFNSGSIARIGLSERTLQLVTGL
jgi:NAD kinase